jgi:two-component system, cell cycle sensor histidine kinase and response regulator CckA
MKKLPVLLIEDNPDDEMLIVRELRKGDIAIETTRVDSLKGLEQALNKKDWKLVISDYCLQGFDGIDSLKMVKERLPQVPFILISGTVGEEIAVESIKAGADDYLLKQNLIRLVPAVSRALREAKEREDREIAERKFKESRGQLDLIYNTVSDIIVFLVRKNDTWEYASANRAFVSKLLQGGIQTTSAEIIGKTPEQVESVVFGLDPESCAWLATQRHRALQGKQFNGEHEFHLPNGAIIGEFTFIPICDAQNNVTHLLIDGRDVTEIRRRERHEQKIKEQMIQAQKMEALGTLSGGIAHDFNNLLTGIMGFADLASTTKNIDESHGHAKQIVNIANRAKDLVQQILTFSRRQSAKHQPVNVKDLLNEVMALSSAVSKSVTIAKEIQSKSLFVLADPSQLHQVFLNLYTNAVYAMPRGGQLKISAEEIALDQDFCQTIPPLTPGSHIKITFSDTGHGMNDEVSRRIFEPFFTTKPIGHGTGLGLSVVHGIISENKGAITVSSVVDEGSTFCIYLPTLTELPDDF